MQSGKAQVWEVGGHTDKDQKQIWTSNMWINHHGSVQMKFYNHDQYNLSWKLMTGSEGGGGGGL